MIRPFPVLPPARQQKPICVIPIPNSSKRYRDVFNPREFWSWGASATERNCVPFDTKHEPYLFVYTFAGTGEAGDDDGPGNLATFAFPCGVTADSDGNLYVADTGNHKIRKINSNGIVSTIAGTGLSGLVNGSGGSARFWYPIGIAVSPTGDLFVADMGNNVIRKISNGNVTTFVGSGVAGSNDGVGTLASFDTPLDVAFENSTSNVYIADMSNNKIRVSTSLGVVTTYAGTGAYGFVDGSTTVAQFAFPTGVFFDNRFSNCLYVADIGNGAIRKIANGQVERIGGATAPNGVLLSQYSGNLYTTDQGTNTITLIGKNGFNKTIAGSGIEGFLDGQALAAKLAFPFKLAETDIDNLFFCDNLNNSVRRVSKQEYMTDISLTNIGLTTNTLPGFPQEYYKVDYSVLGGGGGGGLGTGDGAGGGGGGSGFTSGVFSNVRGGTVFQYSIGTGGSGAYFDASGNSNNGTAGGDSYLIVGDNVPIVSRGGQIGLSGFTSGGPGGTGAYGGGGGWGEFANGSGGIGTINSGTDGSAGIGGRGGNGGGGYGASWGGFDNGDSGNDRGGGGGGHGGGNGVLNSCNAIYYGAGGGGLYNDTTKINSGNGYQGIISIRLTRTL